MKAFKKEIQILKGITFTCHITVIPAFEKLRQTEKATVQVQLRLHCEILSIHNKIVTQAKQKS